MTQAPTITIVLKSKGKNWSITAKIDRKRYEHRRCKISKRASQLSHAC